MVKITKQQLSFDTDFYPQPDGDIPTPASSRAKPDNAKAPRKSKKPAQASLQAFLPGLSRRGRPRSKNPIPPSVRASESRKRRMDVGVKRIELLLEPRVAAELEALVGHFKVSRVEVISRLISKAAKRMRSP
jgi:hypothetical protein